MGRDDSCQQKGHLSDERKNHGMLTEIVITVAIKMMRQCSTYDAIAKL
jgi:hypothetical protein